MNKKRMILLAVFLGCGIGMHFLTGLLMEVSVFALVALSAAAVLLAAWYSVTLAKRQTFAGVFVPGEQDLVFSCVGALLLLAGGVMQVLEGGSASLAVGALCVAGALGLAAAAIFRRRGKNPAVFCYVPGVVFFAVKLFLDFRRWMVDPATLDYCFMLFALICFMLATYHAGEFGFNKGRRRALTFYAMLGFYFGFAAPIAGFGHDMAIYAGGAITLLPFALQSLYELPEAQQDEGGAQEDTQSDAPSGAPEE